MTKNQAEWAKLHDWYMDAEQTAEGWQVWVKENGKMHPWPFRSFIELKAWAGY